MYQSKPQIYQTKIKKNNTKNQEIIVVKLKSYYCKLQRNNKSLDNFLLFSQNYKT